MGMKSVKLTLTLKLAWIAESWNWHHCRMAYLILDQYAYLHVKIMLRSESQKSAKVSNFSIKKA